jgi:hypothetical protein
MKHFKYDFFIAGRWRNRDVVKQVLDTVRASGKTVYCFMDNSYEGEAVEFRFDGDPDINMKALEALPQDHPFVRKVFDRDMTAERESENFLIVLPAGLSAHIELGVAYGLGKKCYAVGKPDKQDTLYCMIDEFIEDIPALEKWLLTEHAGGTESVA